MQSFFISVVQQSIDCTQTCIQLMVSSLCMYRQLYSIQGWLIVIYYILWLDLYVDVQYIYTICNTDLVAAPKLPLSYFFLSPFGFSFLSLILFCVSLQRLCRLVSDDDYRLYFDTSDINSREHGSHQKNNFHFPFGLYYFFLAFSSLFFFVLAYSSSSSFSSSSASLTIFF